MADKKTERRTRETGGADLARIGRSHSSLSQEIADEIKGSILDGVYPPGHRLIEEALAAQMGVSRNPVREALRHLEDSGFVEIMPRKGAWVATIDRADAIDLFQVRAALEALSARLAAELATGADIEHLEGIVQEGESAVDEGRFDALPGLNSKFHAKIASISGNKKLESMILSLRDQIQWIYSRYIRDRATDSWHEHRHLFEAIARGEEDVAAHIALSHISEAERAYVARTAPADEST